jgi:hypothetical protein
VTSKTRQAASRPYAPLKRVLAFALLAFVVYAATAEAIHRHGGLYRFTSTSSAQSVISQGGATSTANDARAFGECLICQFRQQLSFTLLNGPLLVLAPQAQSAWAQATGLPFYSRTDTPRRGRAPPPTSLI